MSAIVSTRKASVAGRFTLDELPNSAPLVDSHVQVPILVGKDPLTRHQDTFFGLCHLLFECCSR